LFQQNAAILLCFRELINLIKSQGRFLVAAVAQEPVTANIARRFLKIIREIYDPRMGRFDDNQASLHKLVTQTSEHEKNRGFENLEEFKSLLLDNIQEIENELETSSENISSQAPELIHSSEMILTIGFSRSVENFLKSASKTRQFEVVVAECAPACRVIIGRFSHLFG
jgi:translation initiation factor eIF-2B subunit beta